MVFTPTHQKTRFINIGDYKRRQYPVNRNHKQVTTHRNHLTPNVLLTVAGLGFYLKIILQFLAGIHKGPTAISKTITLKRTLIEFPDAIDPELSKTNQDKRPMTTVFLTKSGALS